MQCVFKGLLLAASCRMRMSPVDPLQSIDPALLDGSFQTPAAIRF
jgi:hypothetical protein